ncbi:isochorismatase [Micromonospora sp. B006]|nr:isochorismatase [Micromonospora sp. B006]
MHKAYGDSFEDTNLYWSFQTAPGRTAGTVEAADVDFAA